ncbi:Uncharacterised protein [uncultured archaeon]|nr:Uncharacterised protein [uncultured archaeon]
MAKKHETRKAHEKAKPKAAKKEEPVMAVFRTGGESPFPRSEAPARPSGAPLPASRPSPPPIPSSRPALSLQQKTALIGGALILVLVLGTLLAPSLAGLFPSPDGTPAPDQYAAFKTGLEDNNHSAIIMDLRGAPSAPVRQAILQCGVDFVSGGFYQRAHKDLLIYSCDGTGCLSARYRYDLGNSSPVSTNVTLPYTDALASLAGYSYFHIQYAPASRAPDYAPRYADIFISENTTETCSINVQ